MFLLVASHDAWGGVGNLTWGVKGFKREHGSDKLILSKNEHFLKILKIPPKKVAAGEIS